MLMLKRSMRKEGEEQPYLTPFPFAKNFKMRFPVIHYPWEIPEMIQAMVVFVTGVAATAYLQDVFGLSWELALSITIVHEILYCVHQLFGDALIGGWITPGIPLVTVFLLDYEGLDRMHALVSISFILGCIFFILGITHTAKKLLEITPAALKAGILIGAGISAIIGRYGFQAAAAGGLGFNKMPVAFSVGVLVAFFFLFSSGFTRIKKERGKMGFIALLEKSGFVPALIAGYIAGLLAGELVIPVFNAADGLLFNPMPGIMWAIQNFGIVGIGFPPIPILISAIPMAIICYVIAFGDVVLGETLLIEAQKARPDEKIDIDTGKTHILCGLRNFWEAFLNPVVTMSGPTWTGMIVTVTERFKGSKNMYSLVGGAGTFNIMKAICCFIVPFLAIIRPILPLAMSLTLMITAFACFYIAYGLIKSVPERGAAGTIGAALAAAGPAKGLAIGIAVTIVCMYLFNWSKPAPEAAPAIEGKE